VQVTLTITDDGCGFDPAVVAENGGMGLRNMRERAEKLSGHCTITSTPGAGAVVRVQLPLQNKQQIFSSKSSVVQAIS